MDYNAYVLAARGILKYEQTDTGFIEILPRMIEYAELRIYRDPEFDFLATLATQNVSLTASTRTAALPTNIIVPQSYNLTAPTTGQLTRVSPDFLNGTYPPGSTTGKPTYVAMIGNPTIASTITASAYTLLFGPIPNQNYTLAILGTVRPSPLSQANPNTFLSVNTPELFLAASMVFGFGYQRDFSAQGDDPRTSQSWENQFQLLRAGVSLEELRRRAASVSWSAYSPSPPANMQRERVGGG